MIAGHLPGRTDNEIKNYWNSHLTRKIYRYRFVGESTLSAADMLKLVTKTKQKLGRPSRTAADKCSNNANSAASHEQPPASDCLPLANAVPAEPSVSSCDTLGAEGWPDALMLLPPDDAQAMEMLGPLTEVEDEILMHLKYFLEDGTADKCQDVSNGLVMNTDNGVSSEESGCGGWISNSDPADLYACSSPVVSYFTDDLQQWDHDGGGDELNLWSEEEDILIWSWNRHK